MIRLIGCVLTDEEERQSRDGPKSSFIVSITVREIGVE